MIGAKALLRTTWVLCLWSTISFANDADITFPDLSSDHVFNPGASTSFSVQVSDPGVPGAEVFVQWLGPAGEQLSTPQSLPLGQATTLSLPSSTVGHYDLHFTTNSSKVRFPPQDAGFYIDYGFSVLPAKTVAERTLNTDSFFAMVHAATQDPYLSGWIKRKTWNTSSPAWFAHDIKEYQDIYGLQDLPILNGTDWETDDSVAVTSEFLDALSARFGLYLDEIIAQGTSVPIWQLGIEENGGGQNDLPFYYFNLAAKAQRVRAELDARGLANVELMNSFKNNYSHTDFLSFAQSEAAQFFDALGFDVYPWASGSEVFPSPESDGTGTKAFRENGQWLKDHINGIHEIMVTNGGPQKLIVAEMGAPQHGNNNPDGGFGYPQGSPDTTPTLGFTRHDHAVYAIKAHLVALATKKVSQLFWYNYYDREDDIEYPENHFGFRMNVPGASGDAKRLGPTKPAYVAYAIMVDALDGLEFAAHSKPQTNIWSYEFTDPDGADGDGMLVAWVYPEARVTTDIATLKTGLDANRIDTIKTLYGALDALSGSNITLTGSPMYVAFSDANATPPGPTVVLDASPVVVDEGGSSDLNWSSTDADSCVASGDWSGAKATAGSETMGPLGVTSTFTLTCTGAGGLVSDNVNITVSSAPPAPMLTLSGPPTAAYGSKVTLSWTSSGADSCLASGAWSGTRATAGADFVGPLTADSSFTLTCIADTGSVTDDITILVIVDSDSDSLPDAWELEHFGDLDETGAGDSDNDGLTNAEEFSLSTDPADADTDDDSVTDGVEVDAGTDPKDANDTPGAGGAGAIDPLWLVWCLFLGLIRRRCAV
ncbi:MAG: hypothetical protein OES99_07160, partial [Gammaproteobacteria bacterium]|nr:hypothetical protein [Gammaproteobacteria bacterium]